MDSENDIHEHFMSLALEEAEVAYKQGEVPIGAVIVYEGEVIAKAHNLTEALKLSTAHAEILAIKEASKYLNAWRLNDCSIYVTVEPCTMCMGAIKNARIKNLYFGCFEKKFGACGSLYDLSGKVNVYPEIMSKEASSLLTNFFKDKRS